MRIDCFVSIASAPYRPQPSFSFLVLPVLEEVVKHFAYWDALNPSFGHYRHSSSDGPMAISSLMDQQQQRSSHSEDEQVDELDDDEYQEPYQGDNNHRSTRILNQQHTTQKRDVEGVCIKMTLMNAIIRE